MYGILLSMAKFVYSIKYLVKKLYVIFAGVSKKLKVTYNEDKWFVAYEPSL